MLKKTPSKSLFNMARKTLGISRWLTRGSLIGWVLVPFVGLIIALALFTSWNAYQTDVAGADELAKEHLAESLGRVEDLIIKQLEHTDIGLKAAQKAYQAGEFAVDRADKTQQLFLRVTGLTPALTNMYAADLKGNFVSIFRDDPAAPILSMVREIEKSTTRFSYSLNEDGRLVKQIYELNTPYEPQKRPWWQAAMMSDEIAWTPVYTNTAGNALELTRAAQLKSLKGTMEGVVATDIRLERLSAFLKRAKLTRSGVAFLMEPNTLLVASTASEVMRKNEQGKAIRFTAAESGNAIIEASAKAVESALARSTFEGTVDLSAIVKGLIKDKPQGNARLLIAAKSLRESGLPMYLVVAAPSVDFLGEFHKDAKRALFVNLIVTLSVLGAGLVLLSTVISGRTKAAQELQAFGNAIAQATDAVAISDASGRLAFANPAFCTLAGQTMEMLRGLPIDDIYRQRGDAANEAAIEQAIVNRTGWRGTIAGKTPSGGLHFSELTLSVTNDARGAVTAFIAVEKDVTEREIMAQRLQDALVRDSLTHIFNRTGFNLELDMALKARRGRKDLPFVLAFVDLDGFKQVNDQYGHQAGDQVLVHVAQRLRDVLRPGDITARMGGDEFVAILFDVGVAELARHVAEKMIESINEPIRVSTEAGDVVQTTVGASIGLALFPSQADQPDTLLKLADGAMYQAKRTGKNRCVVAAV